LLLGPATSFAKLAALGRTYGTRTIVLGFALLVSCLGLGYAVNALGWSATVPGGIRCVDEHGAVTVMSIAVLGLALIWQLWRGGLGPWFAILEGREGEDDHDHD
jgi:hypothetical protein